MNVWCRFILFLCVFAILPGTVYGFTYYGWWFHSGEYQYYVNIDYDPGFNEEIEIEAAASEWNSVESHLILTNMGHTTTAVTGRDYENVIYFGYLDGPGGSPGSVRWWYDGYGDILEADIVIDDEDTFWDGDGSCSGDFDLRSVLLHVFGHTVGLAHSPLETPLCPLMQDLGYQTCTEYHICQDDANGVIVLYGSPLPSMGFPGMILCLAILGGLFLRKRKNSLNRQ